MWQQQEGKLVPYARTPELFGDVIDQFVHTHLGNGGRQGVGFRLTPTDVRPSRRMAAIQASVSGSESVTGGIRVGA